MRLSPLIAYLGLFLASFASVLAFHAATAPPPFVAEPCPQAPDDPRCWEGFYDDFASKYGAVAALTDLKTRYAADGPARTLCHALLHRIGVAAVDEFGTISRAYAHGETFCRSGYHHGVLEGIFVREGSTALLSRLDEICADIPGRERYAYDYFSCVHGIGHGLMAHFDHDVFASLGACDNLSADWERSSCYGGVFMENVISHTPETPSQFLTEDPLYPCNAVADMYRAQCYMMQTSHMLTLFDGDFARVFEECSRVEDTHRVRCFQSIGRDASGWSYGSDAAILELCSVADDREAELGCVVGAAVDVIQTRGPDAARGLCSVAGGGISEMCSDALEYHIRSL